jgi:XTP/dITP diphosphohydrolase
VDKIFIASNNKHKIKEISEILGSVTGLKVYSSDIFGISIDVNEDGYSLEENAYKKADTNYNVLKMPVISDDTGLFVDALNGEPGIYSARYAGKDSSYNDNCVKLLSQMIKIPSLKRTARFETVICLYISEKEFYYFKGICNGIILNKSRGKNGFGYDPLFVPDGFDLTLAELTESKKNEISHRALALNKFRDFSDSYF